MSRTTVTVIAVVVASAVIIFSVLTGVRGIINSAQKAQAQAIAAIDGPCQKGGTQ
ncbi:MAG TPA: hypothetical protein VEJ88_00040 [Dissulfurispiraceae bacterium]|nr:hypothetical protein [Dissulfurispiraceae bacterium]